MQIKNNMKLPMMHFMKIYDDSFEIMICNETVIFGCGDAYAEMPLADFEKAIKEYKEGRQ